MCVYTCQELYDNLEKQRPKLFRLASETDETDESGISELELCSLSLSRLLLNLHLFSSHHTCEVHHWSS